MKKEEGGKNKRTNKQTNKKRTEKKRKDKTRRGSKERKREKKCHTIIADPRNWLKTALGSYRLSSALSLALGREY